MLTSLSLLPLLDLGCRHTFKEALQLQITSPSSNLCHSQSRNQKCFLEAAEAVLPLYLLLKLIGMVFLFSHTTTTLFEKYSTQDRNHKCIQVR